MIPFTFLSTTVMILVLVNKKSPTITDSMDNPHESYLENRVEGGNMSWM